MPSVYVGTNPNYNQDILEALASMRENLDAAINGGTINGGTGVFLANGNLGVGVTPAVRLHVYKGASGATVGAAYLQAVFENNGDAGIEIAAPNANICRLLFSTPAAQGGGLIRWDNTNKLLEVGTSISGGAIRFMKDTFGEAARIDSTGKFGIGTTTPNVLLEIAGTATAEVLRITGLPKFAGTNSSGGGTAALGFNCPATTTSQPYTWFKVICADGSIGYSPIWK